MSIGNDYARRDAGFTLVEMLVGLVLLALLSVLLTGAVSTGRRTIETIESRLAGSDENTPLALITELLSNCRVLSPFRNAMSGFSGTPDSVTCVTQIDKRGQAAGLYQAWVRLDQTTKISDADLILELALRRSEQPQPAERQRFILSHGVEQFRIEYFGVVDGETAAGWHPTWRSDSTLPSAIRISLRDRSGAASKSSDRQVKLTHVM